jgi:hypothetical protein
VLKKIQVFWFMTFGRLAITNFSEGLAASLFCVEVVQDESLFVDYFGPEMEAAISVETSPS